MAEGHRKPRLTERLKHQLCIIRRVLKEKKIHMCRRRLRQLKAVCTLWACAHVDLVYHVVSV